MESSFTLSFCGGTGSVTGANFLLQDGSLSLLVDCGLVQGSAHADTLNREPFPYDPASVEYLFVTHAHMDHIGRIPKLVKDGFKGKIYSTSVTREIARLMLEDALKLLERQAQREGVLALYGRQDLEAAFDMWHDLEYHIPLPLPQGITAILKHSGHILGSAMVELRKEGKRSIIFTGDLGNMPSPFLPEVESPRGASYMVMESVYGDRNHESKEERRQKLKDAIVDTINRKRTLIIPAFSLERTQLILSECNDLVEGGEVEPVPVFIDSPLAIKVTEIYRDGVRYLSEAAQKRIRGGDDIFSFPKLKFTPHIAQSSAIKQKPNPKIIIAGSGMSNGGRVVEHEKHFLPDPSTTLLLVGYQSLGTLGRQIEDGARSVEIDGETVEIRSEVRKIFGYSSHMDSEHLVQFVEEAKSEMQKVFVAMGEPKTSLFLAQRLRDYVGVDAVVPKQGQVVTLSW